MPHKGSALKSRHEGFMRQALKLAKKAAGYTSPNPVVGAVIVKNGKVVGRGYHKKAGLPHAEAEVLALRNLKGATLYVTLEPCCHWGRTPPCTDAIIRSGIRKVVVGASDPNPKVSGKGISILKSAGIEVTEGILEGQCAKINEWYFKYITAKTPFVTLKLASTLDGRIATSRGESKWITGAESRKLTHRMRAKADAVMVGSGTVIKDDPFLTVRLVRGKNPVRVAVDSSLRIPLTAKIFDNPGAGKGRLIIFTSKAASPAKIKKAAGKGAEVVIVPGGKDGLNLKSVLKELGKREIATLLIEGGARLSASALKEGVVDRIAFFLSPKILGGDAFPAIGALGIKSLGNCPKVKEMTVTRLGTDMLVEGYLKTGRAPLPNLRQDMK